MKKIKTTLLFLLLCFTVLVPAAVHASDRPVIQAVLKRSPEKRIISYKVGQKLQLEIEGEKLLYKSSKTDIATVSRNGLIRTLSPGKTTITVTSKVNNKSAKLLLKVSSESTPADIANRYGSNTGYFIRVNKTTHKVYILKKKNDKKEWVEYKVFPCCTGKPSTPTPSGLFHAQSDRPLYFVTDGGYRCWYATRIYAGYLFHSQLYSSASSPSRIVDGSMGVSCSHGCIRLYLDDAYWIRQYIPTGTPIYIS